MIVRCYPEGGDEEAAEYRITPVSTKAAHVAAELLRIASVYAMEELAAHTEESLVNVCVEPVDDAAEALPGWIPAELDAAHEEYDAERSPHRHEQ